MCPFCFESQNPPYAKAFLGASWPYPDRIIFSDPDVFVVPGYGPQVFPYLLLISRRHFTSFADARPTERIAVLNALRYIKSLPLFSSSAICVFEHGGCSDETHSCISHFHLHLIKDEIDLESELRSEFEARRFEISGIHALDVGGPYLLAGRFDGRDTINGFIAACPTRQAQYFRKKIAEITNQRIWDWRTGMNREMMLRAMNSARL